MKKVAIIAGQLVVGGAERQLYLWLANLDRTRFEPVVLTLHPEHEDYWEKPIENLGIPLVRIPHCRNPLQRLWKIIKVLRSFSPDMVHGWHLFSSVYAGFSAKLLGVKSLGGVRNTYSTFQQHRIEKLLMLSTVNAVVANSVYTANSISNHRRTRKPIVYAVPNAVVVDFKDGSTAREELSDRYGVPSDKTWIGCIGRFEALKRFDLLLKSLASLQEQDTGLHLVLIGDGPERARIEGLSASLGISQNVTFTGEIPNAGSLLRAFDIFVYPSMDEGMPNVIMEAAAAGLPIITWNLLFNRELLINGENAILVEPGNLADLQRSILCLVKNPRLMDRLGKAAKTHMQTCYSLDKFVNNMTQVYDAVLDENKDL